jgi:broad specificity phosphatase PhoE
MGEVVLVRHGQASFGAEDYDRLSPLGIRQGERLGEWFAATGRTFDRIVTGSLRRHRQTLTACFGTASESIIDPGFDEYDHREMLARLNSDFATPAGLNAALAAESNPRRVFQEAFQAAFARWVAGGHDAEYRESWTAFRARCLGALNRQIEAAGPSKRILIFTSGGPIAVMAQAALGIGDERVAALNFALANAGVTTLLYRAAELGLRTLNGFQHLEGTESESLITYR